METQRNRRLGHTATGPFGIPRHISFSDIGQVLNPPNLATSIPDLGSGFASILQALAPILNPSGFTAPRFPEITTPRDRRLLAAEQAANVVPVPTFDEPGFEEPTPRLSPTMTGLPQFEESGFEGQFAPVQPTTDIPTFTESGFLGQEASVQPTTDIPPEFAEIDETNIGAVRGELRKLGNELDLLMASEETITPRMKALSERIGRLETVFGDLQEAKQEAKDVARDEDDKQFRAGLLKDAQAREDRLRGEAEARGDVLRRQTQQFGLLSTLLPLFLQQQQQQAQFGQTQGLAQQRFAQEQAQTRRFETERQEELQRTQDQRQQAASLIPQLFPNMEINEKILSGGIDPSLIPVLISLARLRAEQDVSGQRSTRQPIVTFAR